MAMDSSQAASVGRALVDFALHGSFPDEELSTRRLSAEDFGPALQQLAAAKLTLQSEINTITQETDPEVQSWVSNAKRLEADIKRSPSLANEIARRFEAPEASGQTIQEAEDKVEFLKREASYNLQVYGALKSIKLVNELLDQVEQARDERRILDSLHLLEKSWSALDQIPASKSCRVMKLLDIRAFELKSAVHDVFDHVWNSIVHIDSSNGAISITKEAPDDANMSLLDAVIGLKAYKEVHQRMALLWHALDEAIIGPRTRVENEALTRVSIEDSTLKLAGETDHEISTLFSDLQKVMGFLSERLPEELISSLSSVMMPALIPRLIGTWLNSAVPVSLKDMDDFQEAINSVRTFCEALKHMHYIGFSELQEWAENAPRVWLSKCRETALDSVRNKMVQGLGARKAIERVETQQVSQSEGRDLTSNAAALTTDVDEWGAAWDDEAEGGNTAPQSGPGKTGDDEEDGADAWGWGDDAVGDSSTVATSSQTAAPTADEVDPAAAWGWGDEDTMEDNAEPSPADTQAASVRKMHDKLPETREMTLRETYHISSMPEPVLQLIAAILEDGASLLGSEGSPVAAAASGLFSLPTLVLAMFRAISPYYYAFDMGGNMFLYNDATYLSERLSDFAASWKAREDVGPRAVAMLRLENDIKTLHSFAARAYASEMSTRRTVLRDLIGGSQNLLQQDTDPSDLEAQIESATGYVRSMAAAWSDILARSAWCQAVGSLADTLATKLVADVMDLAAIGQDEAYNIAKLIAKVTELDHLFMPPDADEDAIPSTAQYADNWLRLKFLSEVLQSNLQEVKYLWMESDLSLYFTVDEVVDLIGLSFVDNARTREVVKGIRAQPNPRHVE